MATTTSEQLAQVREAVARHRVEPGSTVRLSDLDPHDTSAVEGGKEERKALAAALNARLLELQELLYAEGRHRVLVVLQAPDTGGKDGTIKHVFAGVNPTGVTVTSFKRPTAEDLAHDYLWRVHPHVPGDGQLKIFNRSHYEDVLAVRVFGFAPEERWARRYDHINAFEQMLVDEGTTILKFFLHISADEQRARLQARLDTPEKNWKFDPADLEARARWDDYTAAYEDMLSRCSTPWAPWWVVPANSKSMRNLVVGAVLVDALERLDMAYPEPPDLRGITVV
jgi:PPK2 family polyphosphate:nucleotide phosphotransferase